MGSFIVCGCSFCLRVSSVSWKLSKTCRKSRPLLLPARRRTFCAASPSSPPVLPPIFCWQSCSFSSSAFGRRGCASRRKLRRSFKEALPKRRGYDLAMKSSGLRSCALSLPHRLSSRRRCTKIKMPMPSNAKKKADSAPIALRLAVKRVL